MIFKKKKIHERDINTIFDDMFWDLKYIKLKLTVIKK